MISMYRSRYFLIGVLLILLGVQFRMVDSFVLNAPATEMLTTVTEKVKVASTSNSSLFTRLYRSPTYRVTPPRWLGLAMIAVGAVISFHAMSVPRRD